MQKVSLGPEDMKPNGIAFIVSAPSGTGKTTILQRLRERLPRLEISVSHTTRAPREGEENGAAYHFVTQAEFKKMIDAGAFLEHAEICGHHYGTAHDSVRERLETGADLILELDVQGARSLRALKYPGVYLFILPPSLKELEARLKGRGTETEDSIQRRLETGKEEIKQYALYDYVVVNGELDATVENILSIFNAERFRTSRFVPPADDIQTLLKPKVSA